MPNAAQHAGIGAVAGGITYFAMCKYYRRPATFGELLLCLGAGTLAAALPDLAEPALHPHHRQIAHSVATGGLLTRFAVEECSSTCELDEFQKILFGALTAGYISHLLADACTPRCLPLIGKINFRENR